MDHSRSGGVLLDLAIHDFDWLRWVLGEVKCLYSRSVGASTGTGPDYALTTLTFDSGAIAHVESTWMDPSGFRTTFEVAGSGGLIQHDSRSVATVRVVTSDGAQLAQPTVTGEDPYYLQLEAFMQAVKEGKPVPVTAQDGAMALSIALAACESAKTGEVVVPVRV
jgi:predicted dehydrogenase